VESLAAFERAFADCLAAGTPCSIEVPVPDEIALTPPVTPWQATLAGTGGRPVYSSRLSSPQPASERFSLP